MHDSWMIFMLILLIKFSFHFICFTAVSMTSKEDKLVLAIRQRNAMQLETLAEFCEHHLGLYNTELRWILEFTQRFNMIGYFMVHN